ncbi:MAG: TolC family protein [Planctomycetes bacterium]|nr:TolC family protein [Planctomycetota bacterium]
MRRSVIVSLLLPWTGCLAGDPADVAPPRALDDRPESQAPEVRPTPEAWTLGDLLSTTEARNPTIGAARAALQETLGLRRQAGLLENPRFALEAEDVPARGAGAREGKRVVALTQPLPPRGLSRSREAEAEAEVAAAARDLEAVRRRVLGEARLRWVEEVHRARLEALYRDLGETAASTARAARARVEEGAAPELEALLAEGEAARLSLEADRVRWEAVASARGISALLGGLEVAPGSVAGALTEDAPGRPLEALHARLAAGHPALAAARSRVEAARARLGAARAERGPAWGLRVAWGQEGPGSEEVVEAGIEVPLPLFDRRSGAILEARAAVTRAALLERELELHLGEELARVWAQGMEARARLAALRGSLVPAAVRAHAQALEAYGAGTRPLADLLEAQRGLAEARREALGAIRELNLSESRLGSILGPLEE